MVSRNYNCKSEEIPAIGGFLLYPLKRDISDFSIYLPKIFNNDYVLNFERKIDEVNNLLNPKSETVDLKNTTNNLYVAMDGLIEPVDLLAGYVKFTNVVPISVKDFGLTTLKRRIHARDAEGALNDLHSVIGNIEKFRPQLAEQGLTDDIIAKFTQAAASIDAGNRRQFEIMSRRRATVDNNVALINDLYKTIIEVCNVGKTLYKGKNDTKLKDYTFNELKKKARAK
jgi:hypothetical protein